MAQVDGEFEVGTNQHEVLSAMLVAINHFNEMVAVVGKADSEVAARMSLAKHYAVNERQAQVMLEFQVQSLVPIQRKMIADEVAVLQKRMLK